jgi:hypothetical protein
MASKLALQVLTYRSDFLTLQVQITQAKLDEMEYTTREAVAALADLE